MQRCNRYMNSIAKRIWAMLLVVLGVLFTPGYADVLLSAGSALRVAPASPRSHSDWGGTLFPGYAGMCNVDSTTYLADAKIVYGEISDQVSSLASIINLLGDGGKFAKPFNNVGLRGYQFLARLTPNWNMGFRKEGVTGVGAAGNQGLANSTVTLKYFYIPILITGQAENLTKGESRAFMQAKALEAKYDMKDAVSHCNVIVAGAERGGQLAQVTAPGAGSFTADNAGLLPGAIYLRVGMPIDTMAVGGGAATILNQIITAINYATRVVTVPSVPGNAVAGNAVALSGEYPVSAPDFPITCEGLVSMVDSTGSRQGLDPATAAQAAWQSYVKDAGAVQLSAPLIQELRQFTKNRSGDEVDLYLFPSSQINQLVNIATTTIRFDLNTAAAAGKKGYDLGFSTYTYAGVDIVEDKDLRTDRIYALATENWKKFEALPLAMAEDEAGSWTRVSGASGIADAVQGLMRWYFQFGTLQRSGAGLLKNLTVPASFQTAPPTL